MCFSGDQLRLHKGNGFCSQSGKGNRAILRSCVYCPLLLFLRQAHRVGLLVFGKVALNDSCLFHFSENNHPVVFFQAVLPLQGGQKMASRKCFRKKNQAFGIPVQTVLDRRHKPQAGIRRRLPALVQETEKPLIQ